MDRALRAALRAVTLLSLIASCGEARGTLVTSADGGTSPWRPAPDPTWQVQLTGPLDTSFDASIYDVDLFDTRRAQIDDLHASGRRVMCYVSVGTFENWRADAASFPAATVGTPVVGFPGESWLDTRDATVRALMAARLDRAVAQACDGVDLSDLSADGTDTGFAFTHADVLDYASYLSNEAHRRGLGAGLGGGADIAVEVVPEFEWALIDGCLAAGDCASFAPFVASKKPVFAVEFGTAADVSTICPPARQDGLDPLIKHATFDAFSVPCP